MRTLPWFWHLARGLAILFCRLLLRVHVVVEGDVPRGAVVVMAKHATGYDIPLLGSRVQRLRRELPYFQMGSFIGYPVLGRIRALLERLGGFCVMRPKEVLRLSHRRGWTRERALATMQEVNAEAERIRRRVLETGGALIVFPEGTRDATRVRPLKSELELRTALDLEATGTPVVIWPVCISFGRRHFPRRRVLMEFGRPTAAEGREVRKILDAVAGFYASHWRPPAEVDEGIR